MLNSRKLMFIRSHYQIKRVFAGLSSGKAAGWALQLFLLNWGVLPLVFMPGLLLRFVASQSFVQTFTHTVNNNPFLLPAAVWTTLTGVLLYLGVSIKAELKLCFAMYPQLKDRKGSWYNTVGVVIGGFVAFFIIWATLLLVFLLVYSISKGVGLSTETVWHSVLQLGWFVLFGLFFAYQYFLELILPFYLGTGKFGLAIELAASSFSKHFLPVLVSYLIKLAAIAALLLIYLMLVNLISGSETILQLPFNQFSLVGSSWQAGIMGLKTFASAGIAVLLFAPLASPIYVYQRFLFKNMLGLDEKLRVVSQAVTTLAEDE